VLTHIHPVAPWFASQGAPLFTGPTCPDTPGAAKCPEPLCMIEVLPRSSWSQRTTSAGVTLPSSLLRAHAAVLHPPLAYGLPLHNGSVPVAVSPGWEEDLPDVISAYLSLRAWTSTPAARVVHLPVSSHTTAAFPSFGPGRRSTMYRTATSVRRAFSGLQSFAHVQAHRFARHPDRSYRYGRTVWQP
jgi:hypothetical protein